VVTFGLIARSALDRPRYPQTNNGTVSTSSDRTGKMWPAGNIHEFAGLRLSAIPSRLALAEWKPKQSAAVVVGRPTQSRERYQRRCLFVQSISVISHLVKYKMAWQLGDVSVY
jgi:hypothetical protein